MTQVGRLAPIEEDGDRDIPRARFQKPCRPAHRLYAVTKLLQERPPPMLQYRERLLRGCFPIGSAQNTSLKLVRGKEAFVADPGERSIETGQGGVQIADGRVPVRLCQSGLAQAFHLTGIEIHVGERILTRGTAESCAFIVESNKQERKRLPPLPLLPQRTEFILPRRRLPIPNKHLKSGIAFTQSIAAELRGSGL